MKLTLIQNSSIHSTALPEKTTGQYYVNYTNSLGRHEQLLRVSPLDGKWCIFCGQNSYICTKDGRTDIKTFTIDPLRTSIKIGIVSTGEKAILLFEDDSEDMMKFKKFVFTGTISIGSGHNCSVVLKTNTLESLSAQITATDKSMIYRELSPYANTFINGRRIVEKELSPGDFIYIMGFSFIVGKDIVAIDKMPDVNVNCSAQIREYVTEAADFTIPKVYFDEIRQRSLFYVSPRFCRRPQNSEISVALPPSKRDVGKQPFVLTLGPSFTMGIASAATGTFSIINGLDRGTDFMNLMPTVIMSGSMMLSSMLWPVVSRLYLNARSKKDERSRKRDYLVYLDSVRDELDSSMNTQKQYLLNANPTLAEFDERIEHRSDRLWERGENDDDFLTICIGLGDVRPDVTITSTVPQLTEKKDLLLEQLKDFMAHKPVLTQTPVELSLKQHYAMGIVGERSIVIGSVYYLILQLCALHSYTDLKLVFIYDSYENDIWDFCRWLPHTWNNAQDFRYVASDADEMKHLSAELERVLNLKPDDELSQEEAAEQAHFVVICASQALASKTEFINHVLSYSGYCGFSVITLFNEMRLLPRECTAVLRCCTENESFEKTGARDRTLAVHISGDDVVKYVKPTYVKRMQLFNDVVNLANIKLGLVEGKYKLPDSLAFLEMIGVNDVVELNCRQRWRENNPVMSLAAPVGLDSRGDLLYLDLHQKAHGPHGLIAGTTGSGKSEFIITMILSLAINFSPSEISFLLIDYKGGGMAKTFESLPHLAGIITNLDGQAGISRSLIAIKSELHRRQELFNAVSKRLGTTVSDIYKYQKLFREGQVERPLQHLYIISDEFAELKSECPDFMTELISAARIGRSLGVHLVLATQKPSGVVNDQIWSNSRFKICLKVQDRSDSSEMLRRPDAAAITQAGRFFMQVGYDEVFELGQSGWAGAVYDPANSEAHIDDGISVIDSIGRVIGQTENELRLSRTSRVVKSAADEKTQLEAVLAYIAQTAQQEGLYADKLWLPPLSEKLYTTLLVHKYGCVTDEHNVTAVIGEYDMPEKQQQDVLTLSLMNGNAIVFGSAGSGKTTFLTAFIFDICMRYNADRVCFYILDFASETLRAFEDYAQVGTVAVPAEGEKIQNLFGFLTDEIARRKTILAPYGGDYANLPPNLEMPAIHLVIANYGAFREQFESIFEPLAVIMRDGTKYGIFTLITSIATTGVYSKHIQSISQFFTMKLADGSYTNVFSALRGIQPGAAKGRGLFNPAKGCFYEFQTAYITESEDTFGYIRSCAPGVNGRSAARAHRIGVMPQVYTLEMAREYPVKPFSVPVGMDRRTLEPVYADLSAKLNAFLAGDESDGELAGCVAEYLSDRYKTIVLDADESMSAWSGCVGEFYSGAACAGAISDLSDSAVVRHRASLAREKETGVAIDYSDDIIYCIINGCGRLFTHIAASEKGKSLVQSINNTLAGARIDFGIRFVIFEKAKSFVDMYSGREWFRKISLLDYCWLGGGLSSERTFRHKPFKESGGMDLHDGFVVVKGRQTAVRFLGRQDD